ncbi:MAG TPA: uroporphyrinogen-III synthase, partial [Candidatus Baltobacteraceae bacterium]|nr:uroporphyrinogen-III synthase [Candidatus Baltobacteraceae bacterium]
AWVVFTSANGARAFFEIMDARREDARLFGSAKIAAIGSATAAALRERGVYPDLTPARFVAEDLAELLLTASAPEDRFLIYRAQEARDVLPAALRERGRTVDVVAAYKTVIIHDPAFADKLAQCDIVTLTSASTVRGFLENAGSSKAADAKLVACIGPITAQAARDAGMRVDVVAEPSTAAGLIAALTRTA